MSKTIASLLNGLLLAVLFWQAPGAAAETAIPDTALLRERLALDTTLDAELRAELDNQLDAAELALEARAGFMLRTTDLQALIDSADQQAEQFEGKLRDARLQATLPEPDIDLPVTELESRVTVLQAERRALGERRNQLLRELDEYPERRNWIADRLVALQNQASESATPALPYNSLQQQIGQSLSDSRRLAALAEIEALEMELRSEPARNEVSTAERSWLGYRLAAVDSELKALNRALERARASSTAAQLETAQELQDQLQGQDSPLQRLARDNRQLAQQLRDIAEQSDIAREDGQSLQEALDSIERDWLLMRRRLDVAGHKELLGNVMITRMLSLPDNDDLQNEIERRNKLIARNSMSQIDAEEAFRELNENNGYPAEFASTAAQMSESELRLLDDLVSQRARLLEDNLRALGSLVTLLLDNNEGAKQLIQSSGEFQQFLLGNLLWVRNFSLFDPAKLMQQTGELLSPASWAMTPTWLASGYRNQPWSGVLVIAVLASIVLRRRIIPTHNDLMSRPLLASGTRGRHLLVGTIMSLLRELPAPLLLYVTGHLLRSGSEDDFANGIGHGLVTTAKVLYLLLLTRLFTNRLGVGRRFLKWNSRALDTVRRELNWAGPLFCLATLVDVFALHIDILSIGGPLGAVATAAFAVTVALFIQRLLASHNIPNEGMSVTFLRLGMGIALLIPVLQLTGLVFAAEMYSVALVQSAFVLLGIKLFSDLLERWLLSMRSRMGKQSRADSANNTRPEDTAEPLDLDSLSEAHAKVLSLLRLVAVGAALYLIWAPSLPALNLLDAVPLWQVTDSASVDGALRTITLFDLLVSVVILVITALVTKHLPSLSDVFMREWFDMSAGARYATSILLQYLIIAIGGSIFLTTIGWEWSKVQWLVAALGVGIGFGLQEIVANFISGIIILFERPIRVGDIISVGGAEGTVNKINPRATVIQTFDGKEHLIPNKELITGEVINWTLSELAVRVTIPVGIAYGSDVRRAMDILLAISREVEGVLDEPEPRVTFEDFGDNSLLLWLRCFVAEERPRVWTELRARIYEEFNAAGIVIAFPQRDVHLDTLKPLQIEISQPPRG